jgi:hypothetical protein
MHSKDQDYPELARFLIWCRGRRVQFGRRVQACGLPSPEKTKNCNDMMMISIAGVTPSSC